MTKIIGNCVSILVLSSALPVMSRTLGITRFDLLGDFGRFNWLGNFYIVLSYNLLFAIVTTLCLIRKFTSAVREELFKALGLHKLHLSDTSRDSETTKPSANGHQKVLWHLTASVALHSKTRQLLIHDIPIDWSLWWAWANLPVPLLISTDNLALHICISFEFPD